MDDLEGRGGREGGLLTVLSVLPIDQPYIWEVNCGSTDGLSPIFVFVSVYCNFMYKQIVNSKKFNWLINIA